MHGGARTSRNVCYGRSTTATAAGCPERIREGRHRAEVQLATPGHPSTGTAPVRGKTGAAKVRLRGVEPDGPAITTLPLVMLRRTVPGANARIRRSRAPPRFTAQRHAPLALYGRSVSAAFFDLDKTIIAGSSTLAFSRPLLASGLITRRDAARTAYAQLRFSRSGADAVVMARLRDRISALTAGWDVATVRQIVERSVDRLVSPLVYDEARGLIEDHRAAGRDLILVSSGGEDMVRPVAALLGIDEVVATRMRIAAGRYTGDVDFYAYGATKAAAARRIAAERGYSLAACYAYSDSITDLPLLEAVGHPTATNPDKHLRAVAAERGWPVLDFARPPRSPSATIGR